jgi:transcriptional regulator with XRE-family HTH domain
MNFREHLEQQLETDPEFQAAWAADEAAAQIRHAFIAARAHHGWTQADLAQRMGTTQANISRAESTGHVSPAFLDRFARAVGGSTRYQVMIPGAGELSLAIPARPRRRGAAAE